RSFLRPTLARVAQRVTPVARLSDQGLNEFSVIEFECLPAAGRHREGGLAGASTSLEDDDGSAGEVGRGLTRDGIPEPRLE
ncbi:MAG: hypothetical protein ACJA0P_004400, partial [Planctomycetota bacterium]